VVPLSKIEEPDPLIVAAIEFPQPRTAKLRAMLAAQIADFAVRMLSLSPTPNL
jgi:hypothetical protein